MKKLNNHGFSIVEGLLILVIIGIISGVGFYVYNANKTTNESLTNTGNSEVTVAQKKESKPTESTPTNVLEIKELGIKFTFSDELKGLYYQMSENGKAAQFSLEELKGTECAADKTAQIALVKFTESDAASDPYLARAKDGAKKFGEYYYSTLGAQAGCSSDQEIMDKAYHVRTVLAQTLPGALEEIKE